MDQPECMNLELCLYQHRGCAGMAPSGLLSVRMMTDTELFTYTVTVACPIGVHLEGTSDASGCLDAGRLCVGDDNE